MPKRHAFRQPLGFRLSFNASGVPVCTLVLPMLGKFDSRKNPRLQQSLVVSYYRLRTDRLLRYSLMKLHLSNLFEAIDDIGLSLGGGGREGFLLTRGISFDNECDIDKVGFDMRDVGGSKRAE